MATWIKLYNETLTDPKMGRMSDHLFRRTIEFFLLAGTVDNGGILPDVEDIAWTLRTTPKDINETIEKLGQLGIVTVSGQQIIITHFAERQMSNLTEAERKAAYRDRQRTKFGQVSGQCPDDVSGQVSDKCPDNVQKMSRLDTDTDIDIDTEVEVEERVKEKTPAPAKPAKHQHGSFKNVLLTDEEYRKLHERFPDADERIEDFSKKKAAKGYVYKSDYAAILSWAERDAKNPPAKVSGIPKKRTFDDLAAEYNETAPVAPVWDIDL